MPSNSSLLLYIEIMAQFESNVKFVPYSQERVYNKLEDLNNLSGIKERLEQVREK